MSMVRQGVGIKTLTYPCINILEGGGSGEGGEHKES